MCKAHLVKSWGILIAVLFCLATITTIAGGAGNGSSGPLKINGKPFNQVVQKIAEVMGNKQLVLLTNIETIVDVDSSLDIPISEILTNVSKKVGLDFWEDETHYYIGKRGDFPTDPAQPASNTNTGNSSLDTAPALSNIKVDSDKSDIIVMEQKQKHSVTSFIQLKYASSSEVAWMFGYQSDGTPPSLKQRQRLQRVMTTTFDPRTQTMYSNTGNEYYANTMDANSSSYSPWMTGNNNRRGSFTDARQIPFPTNPPTGGSIYGPGINTGFPTTPYGPGIGTTSFPGTAIPGTTIPGTATGTGIGGSSLLKDFIPDGIETIVGIESLNMLLVKAESMDAVNQLASFLKLLDKPTKQAVIEVMIVQMNVNDAINLGMTWNITNDPWSLAQPGLDTGGFKLNYSRGNIAAVLSAAATKTRAKIVNAPRVIVQNGGYAQILLSETVPYITTIDQEDVYGRTTSNPIIQYQSFDQGLTVDSILIHPDNSVTLHVTPVLSNPTDAVPLPNGGTSGSGTSSGSVSGSNNQVIDTTLRVKNTETIVMGGYVSDNHRTDNTNTPLLSDLPIIGPLFFRQTTKFQNNAETIYFLTPTVIEDDPTTFEGMESLPPMF